MMMMNLDFGEKFWREKNDNLRYILIEDKECQKG